ncbi:MAG: DUF1127 domain-containing protein [Acidocella sp.]|nr:DUF1127 domain-containing protein [Acidocella sp.]
MTTNIHNHAALGKFGELLFTRQTPMVAAERHRGLLDSFRAWRERRAAAAELSNLSDRDLADIGLTRQDIPNAVRARR